jgi:ParB family chromosome partitioning protein
MSDRPRRLGRGLEALIGSTATATAPERGSLQRIPIAQVRPNPYQPRRTFDPTELADLETSLKASGLLQPIVVRQATSGLGYELVAGERRLRAATSIGWADIPAVVKEIDDRSLLTLALVENLQRTDLNPIEAAEGYQRLIRDFSLTQQEVADLIGKDRTTVTNLLRLLQLPAPVRLLLQEGQLTVGHARALLALEEAHDIEELARETIALGLTVRDVERRVRERTAPAPTPPASDAPTRAKGRDIAQSAEVRQIQDALRRRLQTDVTVRVTERDRGRIEIAFYSSEDLERLLELMIGRDWYTH